MVLLGRGLSAQHDSSALSVQLRTYDSLFPREKVYAHFDRDNYSPGDDIWFKAYLLRNNEAYTESITLYADLLNEAGYTIQQLILPVNFCIAEGSFTLPDSLPEGFYTARFYTARMRNRESSRLGYKTIPVFGKRLAYRIRESKMNPQTLEFFPEGGHFLAAVNNRLSFRCTDSLGRPAKCEGRIVDENGTTIVYCKTIANGYGVIRLKPRAGGRYFAEISMDGGTKKKFPLPAVELEGLSLETGYAPGGVTATINRAGTSPSMEKALLVVLKNNRLLFQADIDMKGGNRTKGFIPLENLHEGIAHLYLLTPDLRQISRRSVYIPLTDTQGIRIDSLSIEEKPKGRIAFHLLFNDSLPLSYSVSVTDADRDGRDPLQTDIRNALLLSSDTGSPFTNNLRQIDDSLLYTESLINLMLIAQPQEFGPIAEMKNNPATSEPNAADTVFIPRFKISGQSLQFGKNPLNLFIADMAGKKVASAASVLVKDNGEFDLGHFPFFDSIKIFHKFLKGMAGAYTITQLQPIPLKEQIAAAFPASYTRLFYLKEKDSMARANAIVPVTANDTTQGKVLENVTVKSYRERMKELDDRYTHGPFSGIMRSTSFDLVNEAPARGAVLWEYLQTRVPGLRVGKPTQIIDNSLRPMRGRSPVVQSSENFYIRRGSKICFYIDEQDMELGPADRNGQGELHRMQLDDIAYIKVFDPPFSGLSTSDCRGGAIAIYTRKGGEAKSGPVAGLPWFSAKGYNRAKPFPQTDYSDPELKRLPDRRITIHWDPFLQPDPLTKKAGILFYNNDITRRLRVVVEGFNSFGMPVRLEKIIVLPAPK